jgi:hypothetical protein
MLVSAGLILRTVLFFDLPVTQIVCVALVIVLACGFGAARGGDAFWYGFFGVDR